MAMLPLSLPTLLRHDVIVAVIIHSYHGLYIQEGQKGPGSLT